MSEYITINFTPSTAGPKAVEWDRCMIVGDASPSTLSASKIYEFASDDWDSQLATDGFAVGDLFYDSVGIFFSASPSPNRLWGYAYLSGEETCYTDVPLNFVEDDTWETPLKPPTQFLNGIQRVRFWCCGDDIGTGWTYNYADGSQGIGYTVVTNAAGNWDGRLTFDNGLSGEACGVVDPLTVDCKITLDFCIGEQGGIGEAIKDYNINMISLSLDNDEDLKNYSDNLFGSQLDDIATMTSAIAGKQCIWFYALPGDALPDETIQGTSNTWAELKNLIGARRDIAVIKAKPSALKHDMAAGYMAMTAISRPHQQLSFAEPHVGIQDQEPTIYRSKWRVAQIASIMKRTELSGDPFFVTYGFTFGSGDVDRIEGTRCQYIIAKTLHRALWGLLAQRDTLVSYDGCERIKSVIRAVFKQLVGDEICEGLVAIRIPIQEELLNDTTSGQIARQQHRIGSIEIDYRWETSLEHITITKATNVAT